MDSGDISHPSSQCPGLGQGVKKRNGGKGAPTQPQRLHNNTKVIHKDHEGTSRFLWVPLTIAGRQSIHSHKSSSAIESVEGQSSPFPLLQSQPFGRSYHSKKNCQPLRVRNGDKQCFSGKDHRQRAWLGNRHSPRGDGDYSSASAGTKHPPSELLQTVSIRCRQIPLPLWAEMDFRFDKQLNKLRAAKLL